MVCCWRPQFERYLQPLNKYGVKTKVVADPNLKGIYNSGCFPSISGIIVGGLDLKGICNREGFPNLFTDIVGDPILKGIYNIASANAEY